MGKASVPRSVAMLTQLVHDEEFVVRSAARIQQGGARWFLAIDPQ